MNVDHKDLVLRRYIFDVNFSWQNIVETTNIASALHRGQGLRAFAVRSISCYSWLMFPIHQKLGYSCRIQ